ncbi:MAG: sialate O-acetylesterase [Acidobacteriia bacterium]|nr:sialate O-acetylesterase [Terriglobia bacterium]
MPNLIPRLCTLAIFAVLGARADVTLPAVLADHMMIQRGFPVHVWGKAAEGESVSVTFRGNTRSTTADSIGLWSVYLPPGEAGGPFELNIKGNNRITLKDVLVGDVWVASGQSNMEFQVKEGINAQAEIAGADHPRIRLFHVKNKAGHYPFADIAAEPWTSCTPESVSGFSAVAYFFGRHLHEKLGVPIGLIETSWGGTPAEAWTSLRALSADASLMPVFASWAKMNDDAVTHQLQREKELNAWRRAADRAKTEGKEPPDFPWEPNMENSWMPSGLYNAMIAPLTRLPIKGAIWYQGESNASSERASLYAHLFETMIQDWRHSWGQGDFPFLFVQLANFKTDPDARWPELRDAQRQTLALANTGMAVTIDIGNRDDIHPKNKQDVGLRLALAARAIAYGEKIEYSGPLFRQATPEGHAMRIWFDHTDAGLTAKGGALTGFEIAGADHKFVPARATIDGATVVVSSAEIAAPASVRYAWSADPHGNLYNADGLPASPFRSGE